MSEDNGKNEGFVYTNNNYMSNSNKYGDAIYKTSVAGDAGNKSWYTEKSYFCENQFSSLSCGKFYIESSKAGIFSFFCYEGRSNSVISFRPLLIVP